MPLLFLSSSIYVALSGLNRVTSNESSIPSEQAASSKAVCDNLDDDTPRLVYADWLQETGIEANIARAEFIRLQIERVRDRWAGEPGRIAVADGLQPAVAFGNVGLPGTNVPRVELRPGLPLPNVRKNGPGLPGGFADVFARVPVTELLETLTAETAAELSRSKHLLRIRHLVVIC